MIIAVLGSDSFLARSAIQKIRQKYIEKHGDAELLEVEGGSELPNWANLMAVPLFATSRLVIVRSAGKLLKQQQLDLASYLRTLPSTTIAVIWDERSVASELAAVLEQASKKIDVSPLTKPNLLKLLRQRTREYGSDLLLDSEYDHLIQENGTDLWALDSALFARIAGGTTQNGEKKALQGEDQFLLFRLIERGQWRAAAGRVAEEYHFGKPIELIIGAIAAALRRSRLPEEERVSVLDLLSELDFALKTGLIEEGDAVALIKAYLPDRSKNRLQWEQIWEELHA